MTTGFIGGIFLIGTFYYFLREIFVIAHDAIDITYKLILIGIATNFIIQIIENIGMVVGLLPITGIVLPFISYGGTALITYMVCTGIILNISSHSKSKIF